MRRRNMREVRRCQQSATRAAFGAWWQRMPAGWQDGYSTQGAAYVIWQAAWAARGAETAQDANEVPPKVNAFTGPPEPVSVDLDRSQPHPGAMLPPTGH